MLKRLLASLLVCSAALTAFLGVSAAAALEEDNGAASMPKNNIVLAESEIIAIPDDGEYGADVTAAYAYTEELAIPLLLQSYSGSNAYNFYDQLTADEKTAYNYMKNALEDSLTVAEVPMGSVVDMNAIRRAYCALIVDNPEYFWLYGFRSSFSYSDANKNGKYDDGETITKVTVKFGEGSYCAGYDESNIVSRYEEVMDVVKDVVKEAEQFDTDYDKMAYFAQYISDKVTYNYNAANGGNPTMSAYANCWNAYGALIDGSGVCESYAEAFKLLCDEAGIPCITMVSVDHEWNAVLLDGSWYYVDVTWIDTGNDFDEWFAVGTESAATNDNVGGSHVPKTSMVLADFDSNFTYPNISATNYDPNAEPEETAPEEEEPETTTEAEEAPETTTEAEEPAATTTEAEEPAATTTEAEEPAATTTEAEEPAATTTEAEEPAATTTEAEEPAATTTEAEKPAATTTEAEKPAATTTEAEVPAATTTEAEVTTTTPAATEATTTIPAETEATTPSAAEATTPAATEPAATTTTTAAPTTQPAETTTTAPTTTPPATTTTPAEATEPDLINPDDVSVEVEVDSNGNEDVPAIGLAVDSISSLKEEVVSKHLTEEEKEAVANGAKFEIILSAETAEEAVPAEDIKAAESAIADTSYTVGQYLNIELFKAVDGQQTGNITQLSEPVSITVEIPAELIQANRVFAVVRVHDGKTDILPDQDDDPNTVTFLTDKFSTYAVVYQDTDDSDNSDNGEDENVNTGVLLTVVPFIAAAVGIAASRKRK